MTPEEHEEAQRLLKAAGSDLRAAEALAADPDQDDDVVGFHSQQDVEKSVKAVIAASGIEIPYTHDLSFLVDVISSQDLELPSQVAAAEWLTPWAVLMRYGSADAPLDRDAAISAARHAVGWAAGIVGIGGA